MSPLLDSGLSTLYIENIEHSSLWLEYYPLKNESNHRQSLYKGHRAFLSTFLWKYNIPEDMFEQFVERNILRYNSHPI